jgi:molecular chaperone GrpE (heat shock protein)
MYTHWVDKAEHELEEALANGEMSEKEFREEMRNIHAEHEQEAQDAAEQAYNDVMGHW